MSQKNKAELLLKQLASKFQYVNDHASNGGRQTLGRDINQINNLLQQYSGALYTQNNGGFVFVPRALVTDVPVKNTYINFPDIGVNFCVIDGLNAAMTENNNYNLQSKVNFFKALCNYTLSYYPVSLNEETVFVDTVMNPSYLNRDLKTIEENFKRINMQGILLNQNYGGINQIVDSYKSGNIGLGMDSDGSGNNKIKLDASSIFIAKLCDYVGPQNHDLVKPLINSMKGLNENPCVDYGLIIPLVEEIVKQENNYGINERR